MPVVDSAACSFTLRIRACSPSSLSRSSPRPRPLRNPPPPPRLAPCSRHTTWPRSATSARSPSRLTERRWPIRVSCRAHRSSTTTAVRSKNCTSSAATACRARTSPARSTSPRCAGRPMRPTCRSSPVAARTRRGRCTCSRSAAAKPAVSWRTRQTSAPTPGARMESVWHSPRTTNHRRPGAISSARASPRTSTKNPSRSAACSSPT